MIVPGDADDEAAIGSAEYTYTIATKRTAAAVLFTNEDGEVLLCEPVYKQVWDLPGGAVEAGESLHAAAVREVGEEIGLAVRPGRLLVVDWVPPLEGRSEAVVVIFDGGVLSGDRAAAIRLDERELRSWAWAAVDDMGQRMPVRPLVQRRIAAALEALGTGRTLYLEQGVGVPVAVDQARYREEP